MTTPTPSDRTTLPTPRTSKHSHAPRSAPTITGIYPRSIDPRHARPAVWPDAPKLSREYRAQDGPYYPFTQATHLSSSVPTTPQVAYESVLYPHPQLSKKPVAPTPPFLVMSPFERNTLRLVTPLTPMTSNMASQMAPAPPPKNANRLTPVISKPAATKKAAPAAPVYASSLGWVHHLRKKRRPSEIFNMNFSFAASSRRSQADRTPPISPRSSFSSGSDTAPPTEESFKRQRVDSSGSEIIMGFPFGKPTPVTSTRGRDLGSSGMQRRDSSCPQAAATRPPCLPPRITVLGDPHPGQLVDFASPSYDILAPLPSPMSEYTLRFGIEVVQDCVAPVPARRRSSFPAVEKAVRRVRQESSMRAKLEKLDTEARQVCKQDVAHEKESERKGHQSTASSSSLSSSSSMSWTVTCPATPRTPTTAASTRRSVALQRTASDPSTEAFLAHVRASLKARESAAVLKWCDYPVFADENEKGFLGQGPL